MKPLAAALLFFGLPGAADAGTIRLAGSDTLGAKLVPLLCDAYRKTHPEATFGISAEGSATAFAKLLEGSADIGMAARDINEKEAAAFKEQALELQRHPAASYPVAIVVHSGNPVTQLTSGQVEGIFAGDITDWNKVGGQPAAISIFTRNSASAAFLDFRRMAMNGRPYAESAQKIPGSASIDDIFSSNRNGIAYGGVHSFNPATAKALKIDGYGPAEADRKKYPYIRHCHYFTRRDAAPEVKEFIGWITQSDEARSIVIRTGFFAPAR